ncbi:MAG: T9SS type A sorting domain-containing protein [Flavobacteriaceae bacterium]
MYTSTYIDPVFYYVSCEGTGQPSSDWRQKKGYFNLDAGDVSQGYNRLEIRIKGQATLLNPIFIDDVELKKVPKVKACFEIKDIYSEHTEPSDYGPKPVKQLCLQEVRIDGSCSANEDGYHIRISEFSLSPWEIITDYYEGWVGPGEAPSNIDLTTLIGVPSANNGWTSRTFDPSKLYAVSLSVGPIWDSAPLQFFRVIDCRRSNILPLENEKMLVRIYPNPIKDHMSFSFGKDITGNVSIYGFDGMPILVETLDKTNHVTLDMSSFSRGIYIVKLIIGEEIKTYKIIKE